ncbi:MAG: Threonylcarbamoyl-AMP synthase [Pedosphaera sp.]|nr:Threonylcarbamoyl-AMP synthase [Pedosphaera sp.]
MTTISERLRGLGKFITLAGTQDGDDLELKAEILSTHTAELFNAAVARAVDLLRAGDVVALPTETVYGLAANALDQRAVARIFEIKGRPEHNPIIVHVASVDMARRCVVDWPPLADALARAFWPGPLTMVLPRSKEIPDVVTAGGGTVGVRWPSHPFIQAVIRQCGFPLAAPSANPSNQVSPTNAAHVSRSLGDKLSIIVDGGQSQVGIESTVLDLSINPPRILRPGMIHGESLRAAVADGGLSLETDGSAHNAGGPLRSPGRLLKHYSPRALLEMLSWRDDKDLRSQISKRNWAIGGVHIIAHTVIPTGGGFGRVSVIPHDAEAFARAIYAELHLCDETGAQRIIVEVLPQTNEWQAIADRLKRASS